MVTLAHQANAPQDEPVEGQPASNPIAGLVAILPCGSRARIRRCKAPAELAV